MADTPDRGPLPLTNDMADRIDWQKGDGLVPAVIQNADDGQVLMLGYMNRHAYHNRNRKQLTFLLTLQQFE